MNFAFVVEHGDRYEGNTTEGIFVADTPAVALASATELVERMIQRNTSGHNLYISKWEGTARTVVMEWERDFNSQTKRMEWFPVERAAA